MKPWIPSTRFVQLKKNQGPGRGYANAPTASRKQGSYCDELVLVIVLYNRTGFSTRNSEICKLRTPNRSLKERQETQTLKPEERARAMLSRALDARDLGGALLLDAHLILNFDEVGFDPIGFVSDLRSNLSANDQPHDNCFNAQCKIREP